jgi:hypothetical protein
MWTQNLTLQVRLIVFASNHRPQQCLESALCASRRNKTQYFLCGEHGRRSGELGGSRYFCGHINEIRLSATKETALQHDLEQANRFDQRQGSGKEKRWRKTKPCPFSICAIQQNISVFSGNIGAQFVVKALALWTHCGDFRSPFHSFEQILPSRSQYILDSTTTLVSNFLAMFVLSNSSLDGLC